MAEFEIAAEEIRTDLKAIRAELTSLRVDVAEIKGRLANIPTSFQLVFMLAAFAVATSIGATGLSLAVLRFSGAH